MYLMYETRRIKRAILCMYMQPLEISRFNEVGCSEYSVCQDNTPVHTSVIAMVLKNVFFLFSNVMANSGTHFRSDDEVILAVRYFRQLR